MPREADRPDMDMYLHQVMTLAAACADDLEGELLGRHVGDHPVTRRALAADLEVVRNLRAALEALRSIRESHEDPAGMPGRDGPLRLSPVDRRDQLARDPAREPPYVHAPSCPDPATEPGDTDRLRGKGLLCVEGPLDPEMTPEDLRLHMGEMTARQIDAARAAIRWENVSAAMDADDRRTAAAARSWARRHLRTSA